MSVAVAYRIVDPHRVLTIAAAAAELGIAHTANAARLT